MDYQVLLFFSLFLPFLFIIPRFPLSILRSLTVYCSHCSLDIPWLVFITVIARGPFSSAVQDLRYGQQFILQEEHYHLWNGELVSYDFKDCRVGASSMRLVLLSHLVRRWSQFQQYQFFQKLSFSPLRPFLLLSTSLLVSRGSWKLGIRACLDNLGKGKYALPCGLRIKSHDRICNHMAGPALRPAHAFIATRNWFGTHIISHFPRGRALEGCGPHYARLPAEGTPLGRTSTDADPLQGAASVGHRNTGSCLDRVPESHCVDGGGCPPRSRPSPVERVLDSLRPRVACRG